MRTDIELPDSPEPVSRSEYREEEENSEETGVSQTLLTYTGAANPWFVDKHTQENKNQYELSGAANPWFVNQHSGALNISFFDTFTIQLSGV